jgi:putative ubiquitin-RnfH superfamily antitoxin RatB of RatAB toxin-antitoxin module
VRVEVVFALPGSQNIAVLDLAEGVLAQQAVDASGLPARHGLSAAGMKLGMFGKRIAAGQRLRDGDRVEILRALAADPNEARRRRAGAAVRPPRRR